MPTELDDFLEHHGVKGMQWGVRKTSASTSRRPLPKPTAASVKYVGKEIGFGSIGPAALLMGVGPPVSIALGISVAVLRSPPVSNAIKQTSKSSADLIKQVGDTKLSAMRQARESRDKLRDAAKSIDDDLLLQLT
jgi:hypothetical protein